MADTPFTDLNTGMTYATMKDEHEIVKIAEKNVTVGDIGKIVQGEINSQEIEFSIPRYYDNVDLLDKKINILYQTKGGIFKVEAIDVAYNDEEIRFNWLMNEDATMYPGKLTAVIKMAGVDESGKPYVMKTTNFSVDIEDALNEYGADGVYRTWATDIESRIETLEDISSSMRATFIGTTSAYDAANLAGDITNGMLITLTDKN